MIQVIGHFGTLCGLGAVAGRVAEGLLRAGLLGGVSNLDDAWHKGWYHLSFFAGKKGATHCLLVTKPNHYMGVYADLYGEPRSAIFVNPNTPKMRDENVATIGQFGLVIAPSRFCGRIVGGHLQDAGFGLAPAVLPIASSVAAQPGRRRERRALLQRRLDARDLRLLHLTTETGWPGNKGTEELLHAWALLHAAHGWRGRCPGATLRIHGPPSLHPMVLYKSRDLGIDETVSFVPAPAGGESDDALERLLDHADLVVQPSRCEGYGMTIAAALDAGVPLVATCATGHAEILTATLGAWHAVSTPTSGAASWEPGEVPIVTPQFLADAIDTAALPQVRERMLAAQSQFDAVPWTWVSALELWVERLREWIEDTISVEETV